MNWLLGCFLLVSISDNPESPFPAGVLDSTGRTAYVASEVGIDAIDLARGERVWRSRDAQLPLLVAGDRLYALSLYPSNKLSVVAYDLISKSDRVFKTDITNLPRWVTTRATANQTFHVSWRQHRGILLLDWKADAQVEHGPAKNAVGQVEINLETGRVQAMPLVVQPPRLIERIPKPLEKAALRWHGRAGGLGLAVIQENLPESAPGHRSYALVLRSWDVRTGKLAARHELMRGSRPVVLKDLDGKHIWLRDAGNSSDPTSQRYWSVFSVLDGHLVARAPYLPGTLDATLIDQRAYYLTVAPAKIPLGDGTPRRVWILHSHDLNSGKKIWSHSLGTPVHLQ